MVGGTFPNQGAVFRRTCFQVTRGIVGVTVDLKRTVRLSMAYSSDYAGEHLGAKFRSDKAVVHDPPQVKALE